MGQVAPGVGDLVGFRVVGTVTAELGDGRIVVRTPYGDFSCQADTVQVGERRNPHPPEDVPVIAALDYSGEPCVCATRWTCMADEHEGGTPY
jgi:hypothetical protein